MKLNHMKLHHTKLHHGGRLQGAAQEYGIALDQWLDFSTAINPQAWPIPPLPDNVWQRLPEEDDGLTAAAMHFYFNSQSYPHQQTRPDCDVLPVPGTQAVIETLPRLLNHRRVWVPALGYQEHAYCWQKHGHTLLPYTTLPSPHQLQTHDIVVVINPNNPTAELYPPAELHALGTALSLQQGLLIVDEAFMDCTPQHSVLQFPLSDAIVVLRSFGKFFGLAGLRLGFCFANPIWLQRLDDALGPWAVNHPARWIGQQALSDSDWQAHTRNHLHHARVSLQNALQETLGDAATLSACDLFITLYLQTERASSLHTHLARQGIFTRWFANEGLLRIGVDADKPRVQRLLNAISHWSD